MRATFLLSLGLGLSLLVGCQDLEQCKDPGVVQACICGPDDTGERICKPEQVWSACDCGADASVTGGTGGMGGMTGGMGGGMSGGMGGMGGMTGGMGGMSGGMGGMSGGMGGMSGGMGGMSGGMGGGDGGMDIDAGPDGGAESDAYAGCTVATAATDCLADSTCIESDAPFIGEPGLVCASACTMAETCAAPADATSDATVVCDEGRCRLSCSALGLNPCPTGMACIAQGDNEYCFVVP